MPDSESPKDHGPDAGYRNAKIFSIWASGNGERWSSLVGHAVVHDKYGRGTVSTTDFEHGRLEVEFVDEESGPDVHRFALGMFSAYFLLPALPESLPQDTASYRAAVAQQRREETAWLAVAEEREASEDFEHLRLKYGARGFEDKRPTSPLYRILLLLEDGKSLARGDIEWLEVEHLQSVLAMHFESEYARSLDPWMGARASACWRKACLPERALRISEPGTDSGFDALAAFLTSRAAALADVQCLDAAEASAFRADQLRPSSYMTLNVLGRIFYRKGDWERSQEYFDRAELGGSTPAETDRIRRAEMQHLSPEQRDRTARFLLARDSERYKWATRYLAEGV